MVDLQNDTTTGSPQMLILPGLPLMPPISESQKAAISRQSEQLMQWMRHPLGKQLFDLQITPEKQLPKRDFLFRLFGRPCFPQGELVAITGKAKSGKTYFCSSLIVAAARGECLGLRRTTGSSLRVLWIDTEQSEDSTQEILTDRINTMIGEPMTKDDTHVCAINLRSVNWDRRLELIEAAMEVTKPQLVIFDGIRDVVDDINNGTLAQQVLDRCMHLASVYSACIVSVLHQNKAAEDSTLRGALGTELMNKSFETYECRKMEDRTFQVEQTATRKYDILQRMRFTVGDNGLPVALCSTPVCPTDAEASDSRESSWGKGKEAPFLNEKGYLIPERLFRACLKEGEELRAFTLRDRAIELTDIPEHRYKGALRQALEHGILSRRAVSESEVYYSLAIAKQEDLPIAPMDAAQSVNAIQVSNDIAGSPLATGNVITDSNSDVPF